MAAQYRGGQATSQQCRVVLLIDLDCFYAQVEQKRCGIPRDVPCAVQQWEGLIAVNYAARAKGISRHMRAPEAKVRCPELQLVHVQTIGDEDEAVVTADAPAGAVPSTSGNSRQTQKACLERYRAASAEIMGLIRKMSPDALVEKASIDEVYLDVTGMVEEELQSGSPNSALNTELLCGCVVIDGPLRVESEFERRLSVGAAIASRLRGAVSEQLGYTMSAGIACNKLLAKVASGVHKPNQQTVVPPRAAEGLLAEMPLGKIRNFGGKLGTELQNMGCSTPGQVAQLSVHVLEARFGDRARWIAAAVRGISDEPVQEKELAQSMLAAKSFNATSDWKTLQRWFHILAVELAERMAADTLAHRRHPRNLVLHYRSSGHGTTTAAGRSRSCAMPYFGRQRPHADAIAAAALKLAQSTADILPCFNLAISATEFAPAPVAQHRSIERFFGAAAAAATAKPAGISKGGAPAAHQPADGGNSAAQSEAAAAGNPPVQLLAERSRSGGAEPATQGRPGMRCAPPHEPIQSLVSRAPAAKHACANGGKGSGGDKGSAGTRIEGSERLPDFPAVSGSGQSTGAPTAEPVAAAGQPEAPAPLRTLRVVRPPAAAGLAVHIPSIASPSPAASPFGSPFARTSSVSSPFAAAASLEPFDDFDDGARPVASNSSSGLRRARNRRSPSAAIVSARRTAFQAAAEAAIAAVASVSAASSSSQPGGDSPSPAALARSDCSDAAMQTAAIAAADNAAAAECLGSDSAAPPLARWDKSDASMQAAELEAAGDAAVIDEASAPGEQQPAEAAVKATAPAAIKSGSSGTSALKRASSPEGFEPRHAAADVDDVPPLAAAMPEVTLEDVDIQEQLHILREIEVRQRLRAQRSRSSGSQAKKRGPSSGVVGAKRGKGTVADANQTQLSGFFAKQPS